jgi:hypothetical protein
MLILRFVITGFMQIQLDDTCANKASRQPAYCTESRMLARGRCGWSPFWKESHGCRYDLSAEQLQAWLDKPGHGQAEGRSQNMPLKLIHASRLIGAMKANNHTAGNRLVQYAR